MDDTRRDKRAPVSLKVRFKSATLDEFREQYSIDLSRGGLFIKSKSPMAVGTLLKFEFQLKDKSRLIHGVGRVVWVREAEASTESAPPGMGIKFIKMDPESRALVQDIIDGRGEQPGRFDEGTEPAPTAPAPMFPDLPPAELPPLEDRTAVRHASEFLATALATGDAGSSVEAEQIAEEARQRAAARAATEIKLSGAVAEAALNAGKAPSASQAPSAIEPAEPLASSASAEAAAPAEPVETKEPSATKAVVQPEPAPAAKAGGS
ncbi:MAG: TIGR02266 family protein, partial [Polyangiaceae bacterium]|nr:TIGR02266 family protein [Polyangiaceae bacterium]